MSPTDNSAANGDNSESAQFVAEKSMRAMWANDTASPIIGITIDEVGPGSCTTSMLVRADMTNGLGVCHGGYVFTLADTAMAFASNSYGIAALATSASIEFLAPGREGTRLTARALERNATGRNGIYDVAVTDDNGTTIALFRGKTRLAPKRA